MRERLTKVWPTDELAGEVEPQPKNFKQGENYPVSVIHNWQIRDHQE